MNNYFLSFAWVIFILVSLIGWGGAVNRILFPLYRVDWGQKAAWGIAWSVIFGGLLNVTRTISQSTILIYICLGALYGIIDAWANKTSIADALNRLINAFKENIFLAIGTVIAFLLAAVPYSGSVSWQEFNLGDDYHAYFVFPNKMLQIGSLGSDPFSERRLVSALEGQSFFHTFSLSLLDERSLYLIYPGCALFVMIGLIIGYCQKKKVSKSSTLLIVFGFLSISRSHINISGILIPVCLLFSLFRVCEWENLKATNIQSNAAIVGLLAAAIKKPGQSNNYLDNLASGLSNLPLVTLDEGEKYSKMLDSVPEGEIVLTRLEKPFLMNFKKHTIWIADWPGGASLPPGMPSFKGEEALADYLVSHSIRYVAYSYAKEANFPRNYFGRLIPNRNKWWENQALNTFEFQDSLQKLGKTRKRIYDDGQNFLIDLSSNKN